MPLILRTEQIKMKPIYQSTSKVSSTDDMKSKCDARALLLFKVFVLHVKLKSSAGTVFTFSHS